MAVCGEREGRWDDRNSVIWLNAIRAELLNVDVTSLKPDDRSSFNAIEREADRLLIPIAGARGAK